MRDDRRQRQRYRFLSATATKLQFFLTIVAISAASVFGDEPAPDRGTAKEAREFVEALASKNSAPKRGDEGLLFPKEFDWKEQDRAWGVIQKLIPKTEDAWPALVAHLDDERYCCTARNDAAGGNDRNWSVGYACKLLISRQLSKPYYDQIKPESRQAYGTMRIPAFAVDRKELKKWCEDRSDKKLYELQIEACKWACDALADGDKFVRTSSEKRKQWIADIHAVSEKLRTSKTPIRFTRFGAEEFDLPRKPTEADPFAD